MQPLFREEQAFKNPWVWGVLLTMAVVATAHATGVMFEKFILGALEHKPTSVTLQMLVALAATGVLWALLAGLQAARLHVRVDEEALDVSFFPLTGTHRFDLRTVRRVVVVQLGPLSKLGLGVRTEGDDRMFAMATRSAVRIELSSGVVLTIGTERPRALLDALTSSASNAQGAMQGTS